MVKVTYYYYALLALGRTKLLWSDDVLLLVVGADYSEVAKLVAWIILAKGFHSGYLMVTNYLFILKILEYSRQLRLRAASLTSARYFCLLIPKGF